MTDRRGFLRGALRALPFAVAVGPLGAQLPAASPDTLQADLLRDPSLLGRLRDPASAYDNDPVVISIERRLRCTCGCTLDIYTCRTTDFSCTFSPALHREVITMVKSGLTPEDIVAALVAREGPAMLMAPPARGFNLAGYLVPGLVMASGALGLAAWLSRRRLAVATAVPGMCPPVPPSPSVPDANQMERLRRALDDVES
ncbi:MAG: cytochrome c-type biogenesis protein CcmH [Gemmatimonadales bacterium]